MDPVSSLKKSLPLLTLGVVAAAGAIVACTGITGVSDLKLVDCAEGEFDCVTQNDASPEPTETAPAPTQTTTSKPRTDSGPVVDPDASAPDAAPDVAELPKPTYCDYTIVASFEDTPNTAAGTAPLGPAPTYEAGRYGKAGRLSQPVFYPVTNGVQYKAAVGSVSVWVKPGFSIPDNDKRVFFRAKLAATPGSSVTGFGLVSDNGSMSLEFEAADPRISHNQIAGWSNTNWVHLVGTWSRDNPRSQAVYVRTPAMSAHQKATDGDAYNAGTNTQFLRLGVEEQPATEAYDDFAVWTRILTDAEVAEIYSSPQSIRQRCEGPNVK